MKKIEVKIFTLLLLVASSNYFIPRQNLFANCISFSGYFWSKSNSYISTTNGSKHTRGQAIETQEPDSGIVVWGDSMAGGLSPECLSAGLKAVGYASSKRKIVNWAIGGQSTWQVAARQGAIPWTVDLVGEVIPASGYVELADHRTPLRTVLAEKTGGKIPSNLHSRGAWINSINNIRSTWVSINGIEGQIVTDNSDQSVRKFLFYRKEEGAPVRVKNPVEIKVLGTGVNGEYRLTEINNYITILWPFGAHLGVFIPVNGEKETAPGMPELRMEPEAEMALVKAMIEKISSPEKRFIILFQMRSFPAPSDQQNAQKSRIFSNLNDAAYRKNFPDHYFDFIAAFASGLGEVQSSKDWLLANYPEEFKDSVTGWNSERCTIISSRGEESVTPKEPAAVAFLKIIENGGRGVKSTPSVAMKSEFSTEFLKTGLKVGVEAKKGKVIALTVREGGRGYAPGDLVTIPSGTIGNTEAIVAEVAGVREETLGTVRNPDGSVDINSSYNQWDLDNGYIPRIFRRDVVHLTARGSEYLGLLLAAKIKAKAW